MKETINIVIPTIVLGVTLLGLAVLWQGGLVDIQLRPGTTIKIMRDADPSDTTGPSRGN